MEINSFIENFAEQFDETPVDSFSPETAFRELDDYSSIVALTIIAMIDEEYGVLLTANEMRSAETVQELFDIVQSKLA